MQIVGKHPPRDVPLRKALSHILAPGEPRKSSIGDHFFQILRQPIKNLFFHCCLTQRWAASVYWPSPFVENSAKYQKTLWMCAFLSETDQVCACYAQRSSEGHVRLKEEAERNEFTIQFEIHLK